MIDQSQEPHRIKAIKVDGGFVTDMTQGTGATAVSIDISNVVRKLAVLSKSGDSQYVISLFSLDTKTQIDQYRLTMQGRPNIVFKNQGMNIFVYVRSNEIDEVTIALMLKASAPIDVTHGTTNGKFKFASKLGVPTVPICETEDGVRIFLESRTDPLMLKGLHLDQSDRISLSADETRAIIETGKEATLWDLEKGERIEKFSSVKAIEFTVGDTAVKLTDASGATSLFDSRDGQALMIDNQAILNAKEMFYDRDCFRVNAWDNAGNGIRYDQGRSYFGIFRASNRAWFDISNSQCS